MNQTIYLKLILAATLCLGLSYAMEMEGEKETTLQIGSVERAENNASSVQKKASMLDIWMCICDNKFHRQFKADLSNNILPDEVKIAIHQIDPMVTDAIILSVLKSVARDEDNPSIIAFDDDDDDIECDDF